MSRFRRFGRTIKRLYLKGLVNERRNDRAVVNNPSAIKDGISKREYFAAQGRLHKVNKAREKRRQQMQKK